MDTKRLARDFLSIGSWVFYVLVLARALIQPYWDFALPVLVAIIPLAAAQLLYTHNAYVARGLVLVFYTSRFYQDALFSLFATAAYIGLLISAYVLEQDTKNVLLGVLTGAGASAIGYAATVI